jgi:hypothetical protein
MKSINRKARKEGAKFAKKKGIEEVTQRKSGEAQSCTEKNQLFFLCVPLCDLCVTLCKKKE